MSSKSRKGKRPEGVAKGIGATKKRTASLKVKR